MAPINKKLKSSLKLLVVVLINLPLSHTCFSLFILYRRILGATAHCQESQMGKRKPQMAPPPQGAHQQHCRVNITGKKKDLPIMIKVDIYLKVHNDNIHTYVIKQNYVIVHAYHNVIYNFFCRYSFYTDRAEFWTQSPSSYQVCHTLTTKNIFIEFAFLCISWLYISWFKSGITILIQLFFFSAMSLFLPNVQHLSTSTRKSTTSSSTLRDQPMTSPGSPLSAALLLWLGTCHRIFHASKFHW